MNIIRTIVSGVALAYAATTLPAAAVVTLAGGEFAGSSKSAVGATASVGPSVPLSPLQPQATLSVPFNANGRYALTGEVRSTGSSFVGGGAGIGKLATDGKAGELFDAFAGAHVLPHTAVIGRVYSGLSRGIGTNSFVGLQLGY